MKKVYDYRSLDERCMLTCAWKGGGPCLAVDCPRRNLSSEKKLTSGQKNVLGLILKGQCPDGWTPVSKHVAPLFTDPHPARMPRELCEFESVGEDGRGRARLTDEGKQVLNAMKWL